MGKFGQSRLNSRYTHLRQFDADDLLRGKLIYLEFARVLCSPLCKVSALFKIISYLKLRILFSMKPVKRSQLHRYDL